MKANIKVIIECVNYNSMNLLADSLRAYSVCFVVESVISNAGRDTTGYFVTIEPTISEV